jgi:hypothetical protein
MPSPPLASGARAQREPQRQVVVVARVGDGRARVRRRENDARRVPAATRVHLSADEDPRFGLLSTMCAHTNASYKTRFTRETSPRAFNRPARPRPCR